MPGEPLTAIVGLQHSEVHTPFDFLDDEMLWQAYYYGLVSFLLEIVEGGARQFLIGLENYTDYMVATAILSLKDTENKIKLFCMVATEDVPYLKPGMKKIWEAADGQLHGGLTDLVDASTVLLSLGYVPETHPAFHHALLIGKPTHEVKLGNIIQYGLDFMDDMLQENRRLYKGIPHDTMPIYEERNCMDEVIAFFPMTEEEVKEYLPDAPRPFMYYAEGLLEALRDIAREKLLTLFMDITVDHPWFTTAITEEFDNVRLFYVCSDEALFDTLDELRQRSWRWADGQAYCGAEAMVTHATQVLIAVPDPAQHPAVLHAKAKGVPVCALDPRELYEKGRALFPEEQAEPWEVLKQKLIQELIDRGDSIPPCLA